MTDETGNAFEKCADCEQQFPSHEMVTAGQLLDGAGEKMLDIRVCESCAADREFHEERDDDLDDYDTCPSCGGTMFLEDVCQECFSDEAEGEKIWLDDDQHMHYGPLEREARDD